MSMPSYQASNELASADPWSAAPFDSQTAHAIQNLIKPMSTAQRLWLSGFLAGSTDGLSVAIAGSEPAVSDSAITIVYGSQSGNCERIATQLAQSLKERGIPHLALDMLDCRKNHLQDANKLLVIVSTHGEGDPPDRAAALHELLHSRKAPSLKHLQYSVLALGDSSYEKFCETGRQFDARLAALGAQPFHARIDCDVDFEQSARQWIDIVVESVAREHATQISTQRPAVERSHAAVATAYTRKNPFHAPVLTNQRLTARAAENDVRHIELSLEGSGIHYEPGDALGIVVRNAEASVDRLLAALPYAAEAIVDHESTSHSVREVLRHCDLGPVTRAFTQRYLERIVSRDSVSDRVTDLTSLVVAHPPTSLGVQEFVQLLRPLAPRLYSIASSPRATPDEVHLTVALVQFEVDGALQYGVASRQLADMEGDSATAPVYLHRNPNFRLPADSSAPVIMIGPGTGIAPFRGFVAERAAVGARGRNWLFFGGRHFRSDFLYQAEWLDYRKRGLLHRVELAFSRDQAQKIYVQHRMLEHGRELFSWLQEGAHLYVCGDAQYMANDVQQALLQILREQGGYSAERANEELLELQRSRRYQRDVY
jgi:sulfite reductase (NADPH) flavoprotein alpha-component